MFGGGHSTRNIIDREAAAVVWDWMSPSGWNSAFFLFYCMKNEIKMKYLIVNVLLNILQSPSSTYLLLRTILVPHATVNISESLLGRGAFLFSSNKTNLYAKIAPVRARIAVVLNNHRPLPSTIDRRTTSRLHSLVNPSELSICSIEPGNRSFID